MLKRLMLLVFALALLIGVGVSANAIAGDFTGDMTYRWQGWDNYDQNADNDDGQAESRLRSRITFGGEVNENALYALTVENYRILGDPVNDVNSIYQASFTMLDFLYEDLDVTVGRMPIAYGRERVLGVEDWNLSRNILFDGFHATYGFDSGGLDYVSFQLPETFAGKYDDGMGDTDLMGLYMHYDASEDFWFEPYALLTTTENFADPDIDNDRLFTFGALVDYNRDGLHFYGEAVMSSGTDYGLASERDISTLGYYAGLFYDFDSSVEPYIGFEYDYASGQDDSADMTVFSSPYGSTSDYLGIMDIVPWSNVAAMRFAGGFTPATGLDVGLDFFIFNLAEQDAAGNDKIGSEIDVKLDYAMNEDVSLEAGLGMFSFDKDSAGYVDPGDPMYFLWLGARLGF